MGILNMIGLVTAEEHAKMEMERDAALAKAAKEEATGVKTALNLGDANKKIAAQSVEIERLRRGWDKCGGELNDAKQHIDHLASTFNQKLADAVQDYQADALAMRKKRQADIIRRQKNRDDAKAGKVRAAFVAKKVVGK